MAESGGLPWDDAKEEKLIAAIRENSVIIWDNSYDKPDKNTVLKREWDAVQKIMSPITSTYCNDYFLIF